jgi:hypothetical protein
MPFLLPATTAAGRRSRQTAIGRNVAAVPTSSAAIRDNIRTAVIRSTADEETAGLGWYAAAHEIAGEIGHGRHYIGAGALAAVSPQTGWVDNITAARILSADPAAPDADIAPFCLVTPYTSGRARSILTGAADPFAILGGRKVRSFYANILRPDRPGPVTVDRHAVAIALHGIGAPSATVSDKYLERSGAYAHIAAAYRTVARELDVLPHQCQAIAWLAHRRTLDENAGGNLARAHIRQRRNVPAPGSEDF